MVPGSVKFLMIPITNSANEARLDISVNVFWGGRYEITFLDVRVFNPHAPSNNTLKKETC